MENSKLIPLSSTEMLLIGGGESEVALEGGGASYCNTLIVLMAVAAITGNVVAFAVAFAAYTISC